MKRMLALGAVVILGLGTGMPVAAVSAVNESSVTASVMTLEAGTADSSSAAVDAAVVRAEQALLATAGVAASDASNAQEVAAMRAYLQGWVSKAWALDLSQLTAEQLKELVAALDEGARGLRLTAGVDRKVATLSDASAGNVVVSEAKAETGKVNTANDAEVAVSDISVAGDNVAVAGDNAAVAGDNVAMAGAPQTGAAETQDDEIASEEDVIEVPKAGESEDDERAASAARWMGLVIGGAVVLAAVGSFLIVKRMKRGL